MAKVSTQDLGTQPIGKLIIKQVFPLSIGILVMSLNILVDTIFVENWIGSIAIAAIKYAVFLATIVIAYYLNKEVKSTLLIQPVEKD